MAEDRALALIEEDFGAGLSKAVAKNVMVYHRRRKRDRTVAYRIAFGVG